MGTREMLFDFIDQQDYVANPDGPPLPDRQYFAADWAAMFRNIFTDGIIGNISGDSLKVTATNPNSMILSVQPGGAWINGRYWEIYTSPETVTIESNNSGQNRIDRVVTRIDFDAREIYEHVIQGTPAASPVAPPIVRNSQFYDLKKARVLVANSALAIGSSAITDERDEQSRILDSYIGARHEVQYLYNNTNRDTLGNTPAIASASIIMPGGWNSMDVLLFGYCGVSVANARTEGAVAQRRVRLEAQAPSGTTVYSQLMTAISVLTSLGGTANDTFIVPLADVKDSTVHKLFLHYEAGNATIYVDVRRAFAIKFWKG